MRGFTIHLIIAPLEKGRVDCTEGLEALRRKAGGEGDGVLLCYSDVETSVREPFLENVEAGAPSHGGVNSYDLMVSLRFGY